MSKNSEEAMQLVGVATNEISSTLDYFFSQVPVSQRAALERLIERLAILPGFVGLKSGIDPEPILRRAIANLHVTDQALAGPGEAAPRIDPVVNPMNADELNAEAEPLREAVRQMALAGVPPEQAAIVLMTFAAQILLQVSGGDCRHVSLALSAFAGTVDKGRFDQKNVM